jgi:hypothetical protein
MSMNKETKPIIEYLLESEEYVQFDPSKHNKFHFNMARLVKDEIRSHKWVEAEKGRNLSWEDAVEEWMNYHYDDFIMAMIPQKRVLKLLEKQAVKCFEGSKGLAKDFGRAMLYEPYEGRLSQKRK